MTDLEIKKGVNTEKELALDRICKLPNTILYLITTYINCTNLENYLELTNKFFNSLLYNSILLIA